jgi:hypothetical protein
MEIYSLKFIFNFKQDKMKKRSLIITMLLFAVTLMFAQEVNVPKAVKATFTQMFPEINTPVWKQNKENYQAQFKDEDDTIQEATFSADGKWIKTASIIYEDELPEIATEYILDNYEEFEVDKIRKVTTNKGNTSYTVMLTVGEDKIKLSFNEDGEYIEK